MLDKKPRLRKAPMLREVTAKKAEAEPKPARDESKLLARAGRSLGIFRLLLRLIAIILWPLRKVLSLLVPRYFINAWRELRQVTWPSRRETWRLTLAVFVFAVVFGSLVYVVDKGISEVFKRFVLN